VLLGMGPRHSAVELDDAELRVRMGVSFRARIPRSSLRDAARGGSAWLSIGVHANLRFDSWLVNGSPRGIVWLHVDPAGRGRALGIPVRVRRLGLSLEQPEAFLATLVR
jgi:hypothetical protein